MSKQSEDGRVIRSTCLLDCAKWKIEHRDDGFSFIAFPYNFRGSIEYGWIIGPTDRYVAEWLFDAVKQKQAKFNTENECGVVLLAEQIARKAHANQFRRDGVTPYITHPEAVVKKLGTESDDVLAVAWLHDVLEDTCVTVTMLLDSGIPKQVVDAVVLLTKKSKHSYDFYINSIRENEIARKVKIADMLHNLSDSPTQNQIVKYASGLLTLLA